LIIHSGMLSVLNEHKLYSAFDMLTTKC